MTTFGMWGVFLEYRYGEVDPICKMVPDHGGHQVDQAMEELA